MVLTCDPYFNSIPAAVDMICVRNYQKVMFIGATIVEMCVSFLVIYVYFYCYWVTTLQQNSPSKGENLLEGGEQMEENTSSTLSFLRCYFRHGNHPRQLGREELPSPLVIDYELSLPSRSDCFELTGVIPNDTFGTFCADRDSLALTKLLQ